MENILTNTQFEAVNERFNLDLDYGQAKHYRAAQVIFGLWKQKDPDFVEPEEAKAPDQEDLTEADNPSSDQDPGDTA
jgi:hypothetical protein